MARTWQRGRQQQQRELFLLRGSTSQLRACQYPSESVSLRLGWANVRGVCVGSGATVRRRQAAGDSTPNPIPTFSSFLFPGPPVMATLATVPQDVLGQLPSCPREVCFG